MAAINQNKVLACVPLCSPFELHGLFPSALGSDEMRSDEMSDRNAPIYTCQSNIQSPSEQLRIQRFLIGGRNRGLEIAYDVHASSNGAHRQ